MLKPPFAIRKPSMQIVQQIPPQTWDTVCIHNYGNITTLSPQIVQTVSVPTHTHTNTTRP